MVNTWARDIRWEWELWLLESTIETAVAEESLSVDLDGREYGW
jgi:hypothetical protein